MKKITVLGVTGSIGTQTVDVVKNHKEEFQIVAMSAGRNISLLEEIMKVKVEFISKGYDVSAFVFPKNFNNFVEKIKQN